MEEVEKKLLSLAESVRFALADWMHTNNPDLLNSGKLTELYIEADGILAEFVSSSIQVSFSSSNGSGTS